MGTLLLCLSQHRILGVPMWDGRDLAPGTPPPPPPAYPSLTAAPILPPLLTHLMPAHTLPLGLRTCLLPTLYRRGLRALQVCLPVPSHLIPGFCQRVDQDGGTRSGTLNALRVDLSGGAGDTRARYRAVADAYRRVPRTLHTRIMDGNGWLVQAGCHRFRCSRHDALGLPPSVPRRFPHRLPTPPPPPHPHHHPTFPTTPTPTATTLPPPHRPPPLARFARLCRVATMFTLHIMYVMRIVPSKHADYSWTLVYRWCCSRHTRTGGHLPHLDPSSGLPHIHPHCLPLPCLPDLTFTPYL